MRNSLLLLTILFLSVMTVMAETTRAGDTSAANAGAGTGVKTADAAKEQKSNAEVKDAAKSDKRTPPPDPNRRWIMRQRDYTGTKAAPAKRKPLKWQSKAQQAQCAKYERQLGAHFEQARYFSIQGDRCKTAQYAEEFIETAELCQNGCPKEFLEYNGFSDEILRNMHQLKALGTESCLGRSATDASKMGKAQTDQAAAANATPPNAGGKAEQHPAPQPRIHSE